VSDLQGKVAIVTGGGSNGIGRQYARTLGNAGASVVVADINEEGALATAKVLEDEGIRALGVKVDVTDPQSIGAMVETAREHFGGVDILINNAALMAELSHTPLVEYPLDEWNLIIAVNVTGVLLCTQAVVPSMRERGGGRIVNQSSAGGFPPGSAYGLSKYTVSGLTMGLARQLGKDNILVNAIAPGLVNTDAGFRLAPEGSASRERIGHLAATRAFGVPEDLSGVLLLLTSRDGDWITGQTISADGGWVMRA
jgi:NAD(P)-dependent dehydrogenase (short-subunit alcohol dehydrogenase family)